MDRRLILKFYFALLFIISLANSSVLGQTTLSPGDLAIIGFKTKNTSDGNNDAVKLVTFVDLTCGTTFIITDNNWNNSTNSWACDDDEFGATVTVTSKICAGSVIYMDVEASGNAMTSSTGSLIRTDLGSPWGTNYGFNAQGDNFFILQGTRAAPNFIYAIKHNGAFANGPCTGSNPKDNTGLPSALTLGTTAIVMPSTQDQWHYKCSATTSDTKANLLAAIGNTATNWTSATGMSWDNSTCTFSVTGSCTAPTHKPSSFTTGTITTTTAQIGWSNCPAPGTNPGNTKVLVIARAIAPVTTDPTTSTVYTANAAYGSGSAIGAGFVVYDGMGTSVTLTGLTQGTNYYFSIYEYSCTGNCYNTDDLPGNLKTLPVELVYFYVSQVKDNIVEFEWATASEHDNKYFEVQGSNDGANFVLLGNVTGHGSTQRFEQYNFSWNNNEPLQYFRLKQIDFDGKHQYSDIVALDNIQGNNFSILSVYPQPSTDKLNVLFNNGLPVNSKISLLDLSGAEVMTHMNDHLTNHIDLNLEDVPPGVYIINIVTDIKVLVQKIYIE